jgi:hypothetical protein
MLTKYKITVTVTQKNILIFNERSDKFVVTSGLIIAPIYSTASRNNLKIFFQEWDSNPRPH